MAKKIEPNRAGLTTRITSGGLVICRLHYAADEEKNPSNEVGLEWLRSAIQGYPGGLENPDWKKEMEIFYLAGSGERVLGNWHEWLRNSNIFIDGEVDISDAKLYGSYDHGFRNPACYLVHAVYPDDLRRTVWEFYAKEVPQPMIARIIKGETVTLTDGRVFEGNPYAGKESQMICDPEIMRETQIMSQGPNKSVASLFQKDGIYFIKGSSGDDVTVASWLTGNLWLDPFEPGYQIHRRCENLIWELGRLQRKGSRGIQAHVKNQPESLLDKDNHAWDALKYWLKRFPVGVRQSPQVTQVADFNFWRDLGKKKIKKSYVRDFR